MANNYTQASFTILCSQEQAQMALDAIAYVTDTDVAEGEHLLSKPVSECSLTELLVLGIIQNHPECDPFERLWSVGVTRRQLRAGTQSGNHR